MVSKIICSVNDCGEKHYAKSYCSKHYQRLRKYGALEKSRKKPVKHGTLYGYQGRGCRCIECTEAASSYMRVRRGGSPPKLAQPKYGIKASTNNRTREDDET